MQSFECFETLIAARHPALQTGNFAFNSRKAFVDAGKTLIDTGKAERNG